jgi:hypothetical protein
MREEVRGYKCHCRFIWPDIGVRLMEGPPRCYRKGHSDREYDYAHQDAGNTGQGSEKSERDNQIEDNARSDRR